MLAARPPGLARRYEAIERTFRAHARVFLPGRGQKAGFLLCETPPIPSCHRMLSVAIPSVSTMDQTQILYPHSGLCTLGKCKTLESNLFLLSEELWGGFGFLSFKDLCMPSL